MTLEVIFVISEEVIFATLEEVIFDTLEEVIFVTLESVVFVASQVIFVTLEEVISDTSNEGVIFDTFEEEIFVTFEVVTFVTLKEEGIFGGHPVLKNVQLYICDSINDFLGDWQTLQKDESLNQQYQRKHHCDDEISAKCDGDHEICADHVDTGYVVSMFSSFWSGYLQRNTLNGTKYFYLKVIEI